MQIYASVYDTFSQIAQSLPTISVILLHLVFLAFSQPDSAKKIVMAVKAGGGADPEKNRQLAQVIADAKVNNVPRDVIERQLSKANAATTIGKKHNVNLRILFSSSHTYFFAEFLHSPFNLNSNFMLTILS